MNGRGVNGRAAAERAASTCRHEAIRGYQRSSELIIGDQRQSEVLRGTPSGAIRGTRRYSIRGNQRYSERGEHLPRHAPMATLEPRHVRSEAWRGREGEPFVTVAVTVAVTVRRACSRRGRYRYERMGDGRRGRPRQPVGVMESKLIPSRPADCEHPRAYLMREAISMPSKPMSVCNQDAIRMQSANNQQTISMQSSGVPPAAARCRHRSAHGR